MFLKEKSIGDFFLNDILEFDQLNRLTPSLAFKML